MPTRKMVTEEKITEAKRLYALCSNCTAPNHQVKAQLIELYNSIYGTGYRKSTNCSSCINTVFQGIKKLALGDSIKNNNKQK